MGEGVFIVLVPWQSRHTAKRIAAQTAARCPSPPPTHLRLRFAARASARRGERVAQAGLGTEAGQRGS